MKILVATSNKYAHLMNGFALLWNKYGGEHFPVICLYYDVPPLGLPANFNLYQVGEQSAYSWTGGIRKYLQAIQDEHVILMLEDYWLVDHLRINQMHLALTTLRGNPSLQKVDLAGDRQGHAHSDYDRDFIKAERDNCLTSVLPALWRRSFLLECIGNYEENPWEFETTGTHRLWERGWFILGLKVPAVLCRLAVRSGNIGSLILEGRSEEDIRDLREARAI